MSQVHKDFHKITQIDPLRNRLRELVKDLRSAKKEGKQPHTWTWSGRNFIYVLEDTNRL